MKPNITGAVILICAQSAALAAENFVSAFDGLVDEKGHISLPDDYRTAWALLGSWSIAIDDPAQKGASGIHNVYAQRGAVEYYQRHGEFPDGAYIIKELLSADTAPMSTGTVSKGGNAEGWFVMIKDTKGRFEGNSLWGDGWGWALFNAEQRDEPITRDYKIECTGCHIPAKQNDWLFVAGYPVLKD